MRTENSIRRSSVAQPIVELDGVTKSFGPHRAIDRLALTIARGEVHALLGPNGSGKSTTVRMIATLLRPDAGTVRILGYDTVRDAAAVKKHLGLVGQFAALDLRLTGLENLTMFGALAGLSRRQARERAHELLDRFGLAEAGHRLVSGWSGGMRRRLDIVAAVVVTPSVLLLDEPTTALDPVSRMVVYDMVRTMAQEGTAVVLTTQYLDEADQLADRVTILEHGRTVVEGSPTDIKRTVGEGITVTVDDRDADRTAPTTAALGLRTADREPGETAGTARLTLVAEDERHRPTLAAVLRALDDAGIGVDDIGRRHPTLDEAFLALTGTPHNDDHQEALR
ncbi:ABC transporter ATP-binding protein [Ruania zhangjianzhongii]|uniref:ABC transporter ATP-binding protein n=1 Tax=Ruania zhangjianzhongii TaxID=2603206 RepID=UPI0011CCC458|nr:ATP-binding cassette domain-containing protein [Ruania zhangjianzhongii]